MFGSKPLTEKEMKHMYGIIVRKVVDMDRERTTGLIEAELARVTELALPHLLPYTEGLRKALTIIREDAPRSGWPDA